MIPKQYEFLLNEPGPKMLKEFMALVGTKEVYGSGNNPVILAWAREVGLANVYTSDSVPWCGLFMALIAKRAGKEVVKDPLWARNWQNFGTAVAKAELGDVLVFARQSGGHVGIYLGEDGSSYHVGGGNQSDQVGFTRILKNRCIAIRRPVYKIAKPANVRSIVLSPTGPISTNEQ